MKSYYKAFLSGWLVSTALRSLYEDLLGKEAFLRRADAAWVSGWVTVPMALFFIMPSWVLLSDAKKDSER